jgi:hypothetical protein
VKGNIMTIANHEDLNFEELQSSLEDLGFQYESGNFEKEEMIELVNRCCKVFLFTEKQLEVVTDALTIMESNYQHCVDELELITDLSKDNQELLEERKTVIKEIDKINLAIG